MVQAQVPKAVMPRLQQLAALLLAAASASAHAQSSISYTVGTGAGDYRSQTLEAGIAPESWPIKLDADVLQARESGAKVMDQYGLSVAWPLAPAWSLRYRWSNQKDTVFRVSNSPAHNLSARSVAPMSCPSTLNTVSFWFDQR